MGHDDVQVSAVDDGEQAPDGQPQQTTQSNGTLSEQLQHEETHLVQVMQSLREQLDRIESTYDASRKQGIPSSGEEAEGERAAATQPKPSEESQSLLFGTTKADT